MFKRTEVSTALAIAFGGVLATAALPGMAQQEEQKVEESKKEPQKLERVEITGSSIRRVDAETALPVTIIKRADIERSGATTAQDLVNLMPSNFGGGVVANNVGSTGNASTANLRSLGAKYTLVLLNGRRIANYAFGNSPVDLNSIPISAIERVEVLRDGASATYGADAVAGVINFILRKDYKGLEASVYDTKVEAGGGNVKSFNITGGYGDIGTDRFNVLVSFNHEADQALKAKDRSFANTANRPDLGINKASPRNGIPNLNFSDTRGNTYSGVNPFRYLGCVNQEFSLVIRDSQSCGTDYVKYIDLIPKATHDNLVARGVLQLNADAQLYTEVVHTKDELVSVYSPAPYTKSMVYPTTGRFYPGTITIPKGYVVPKGTTYTMPDGTVLAAGTALTSDVVVTPTGPISGTWRTVAGGGRTDLTETTNDRLLFGSKGTIGSWEYDSAVTFSKNRGVISFGPGQYSYEKLTPLVNVGAINVFGSQDATSLAALNSALLTGVQQSATSTAREFDFRMSNELAQLAYGPVGFAVGASIRREVLDQVSEDVLASGDQVGGAGPIPSVSGSRKVYGLFSEASVPLYKDLDLQLTGRYDKYSNGFGTTFSNLSPKAALRFQPIKEVVARASLGTGYRAPTLYENLRPFTSGNNTNANWSDPIRCPNGVPVTSVNVVGKLQDECNVQLPTAVEGSKTLKPEKSKQFSLGLVVSPANNFLASLDYWDVTIKNAIQPKSEYQVLTNPAAFVDNFYRYNPADPNQTPIKGSVNPDFPLAYIYLPYDNTAKFLAAGWDLGLNYKQPVDGLGVLGAVFDLTYYTKHGYQYTGGPVVSDIGSYQDFGPVPRWRHALTVSVNREAWNASLTQNYTSGYGDYTNPAAVGGANYPAERRVSFYETFDGQIGWQGVKNLNIAFGIKNLFDQDPPSSRTEANFQTGYDATFTNPLGRTYYLRAQYKFF